MRWVSEEKLLHLIEDIKTIFARKDEVPKKLSELENDIGAGVGDGGTFEEKDPTVPSWAKNPTKPKYTASEVGALPDRTKIPSKTSDLQNDSGFLTEHQDLSGYALKSEVPKSASDVGADASGTAAAKVAEHNTNSNSHNDIRLLVQGLTNRLNALADSDDTTLDQMSEVVAYIKSNKSLIDAIITSKVNVSDIIDNLTTNVSNKPLSASQGVALKNLIDAIIIPTVLPNPKALTFTGAVTGSYDGSEEFSVEIPSGGGGSASISDIRKIVPKSRLLKKIDITTDDEGNYPTLIDISEDEEGNPFSIYAFSIVTDLKTSSYTLVGINGMGWLKNSVKLYQATNLLNAQRHPGTFIYSDRGDVLTISQGEVYYRGVGMENGNGHTLDEGYTPITSVQLPYIGSITSGSYIKLYELYF